MFFANSNLIPKVFYLFLIHNIAELKSDKWSWERGWLHVTCKKNYFTFYLDPWVNFFPLKSGWIAFQIQKNCLVIEARKYFTASCFWGQHSHTKIGNIPKRYNNASKKNSGSINTASMCMSWTCFVPYPASTDALKIC